MMGHNPFFSPIHHVARKRERERERTRSRTFLPRRSISSSMLDREIGRQHSNSCGLAGAIWPQEPHDLAFVGGKATIRDRLVVSIEASSIGERYGPRGRGPYLEIA